MVRLVDDLLDMSRITQGKLRLHVEPVELRGVVNAAADSARPLLAARRHDFSVALPTDPLWVQADPARLEQVIVNLLNNAAKYTDPGGLVRVTVHREGAQAVVLVRDNGVGIAAEKLDLIFHLFTQVDGSVGRSNGGLGIGLALARTLMELHGGTVGAQSEGPGKGCEFALRLPVLGDGPGRAPRTTLAPGARQGRRLQILVVEDNVDTADSLSLLLRLYGHEVQVARTGPAALELAAGCRPDVVLLDIGLPGMDGYEVACRLRGLAGFARVMLCALTGYSPGEADRQRGQESRFDHFLVKPVDLELFQRVDAAGDGAAAAG
jgi:CheY-like chemotaxis protein/two-component sensor histidine kinase